MSIEGVVIGGLAGAFLGEKYKPFGLEQKPADGGNGTVVVVPDNTDSLTYAELKERYLEQKSLVAQLTEEKAALQDELANLQSGGVIPHVITLKGQTDDGLIWADDAHRYTWYRNGGQIKHPALGIQPLNTGWARIAVDKNTTADLRQPEGEAVHYDINVDTLRFAIRCDSFEEPTSILLDGMLECVTPDEELVTVTIPEFFSSTTIAGLKSLKRVTRDDRDIIGLGDTPFNLGPCAITFIKIGGSAVILQVAADGSTQTTKSSTVTKQCAFRCLHSSYAPVRLLLRGAGLLPHFSANMRARGSVIGEWSKFTSSTYYREKKIDGVPRKFLKPDFVWSSVGLLGGFGQWSTTIS